MLTTPMFEYEDDDDLDFPPAPKIVTPPDPAMLEKIDHSGVREMFLSIHSYDPESAKRYFYFCYQENPHSAGNDLEGICRVLPLERSEAIPISQIRSKMEKINPLYNKSSLSRNLDSLISTHRAWRRRTKTAYVYWRNDK